jgi:hypothetical protein
MNDNIEVTNTGEYVSVSKGNNLVFDQGHGVIKTKDGGETANYTFIEVGNGTDFQGASAFSTNSTGELSFLNNILVIYKIDGLFISNFKFPYSEVPNLHFLISHVLLGHLLCQNTVHIPCNL